jgi:hypothetical protein
MTVHLFDLVAVALCCLACAGVAFRVPPFLAVGRFRAWRFFETVVATGRSF